MDLKFLSYWIRLSSVWTAGQSFNWLACMRQVYYQCGFFCLSCICSEYSLRCISFEIPEGRNTNISHVDKHDIVQRVLWISAALPRSTWQHTKLPPLNWQHWIDSQQLFAYIQYTVHRIFPWNMNYSLKMKHLSLESGAVSLLYAEQGQQVTTQTQPCITETNNSKAWITAWARYCKACLQGKH